MARLMITEQERVQLQNVVFTTASAREYARAQALLWLAEGLRIRDVAELLSVSRQTIFNWRTRFAERRGRPIGERLRDAPRPGRPAMAGAHLDDLLAEALAEDPHALGYRARTWTAPLLCDHLRERHQITVSRKTVSRSLERIDIRWKRPRHALANRPETWRQAKGGSNAG